MFEWLGALFNVFTGVSQMGIFMYLANVAVNLAMIVVVLIFGIGGLFGVWSETLDMILSSSPIPPDASRLAFLPLPMWIALAAFVLFLVGGCLAFKYQGKKFARTILWVSFGLFVAGYALDPDGRVFIGNAEAGLEPGMLLLFGFFVLVTVALSHLHSCIQHRVLRKQQLKDSAGTSDSNEA